MPKPLPQTGVQNNAEPVYLVDGTTGLPIGSGSGGNPNLNPATVYTAQQTATSSAVALAAQSLSNGVVLTNLSTSTNDLYVGPSGVTSGTGYKLIPGQSISFGVTNTNAIYVIAPTGSPILNIAGN